MPHAGVRHSRLGRLANRLPGKISGVGTMTKLVESKEYLRRPRLQEVSVGASGGLYTLLLLLLERAWPEGGLLRFLWLLFLLLLRVAVLRVVVPLRVIDLLLLLPASARAAAAATAALRRSLAPATPEGSSIPSPLLLLLLLFVVVLQLGAITGASHIWLWVGKAGIPKATGGKRCGMSISSSSSDDVMDGDDAFNPISASIPALNAYCPPPSSPWAP